MSRDLDERTGPSVLLAEQEFRRWPWKLATALSSWKQEAFTLSRPAFVLARDPDIQEAYLGG